VDPEAAAICCSDAICDDFSAGLSDGTAFTVTGDFDPADQSCSLQ
jgi:hypothetical protein